jgi:Arc/MetJ-type ribon-helix-helix transcriptional regulator
VIQITRKTITFDLEDEKLLDRVVNIEKQYDSYSAAVRRAVRATFKEKKEVLM